MRANTRLTAVALLAAALAWAPAPAEAESHELATTTFGAMTEQADAVLVAAATDVASDPADARRFRVTETLRGELQAGETVDVAGTELVAEARAGAGYLLFLTRLDDGRHAALSRFAVRETEGLGALVDYTRSYAQALGTADPQARRDALRSLLVGSLGSAGSGVPFCAGTDLVRRVDLHAEVSQSDRERIALALGRPRRADLDLAGVVAAAGVLGDERVDAALVARLLDPRVRTLRRYVTRALARRANPELVATLVARIPGADVQQRRDIANALGRMGADAAAGELLAVLRDDDADVRVEAAHALGRIARAVRRKPAAESEPSLPGAPEQPETAPRPRLSVALGPLLGLARRATAPMERKAALWAVAQIDTQAAWTALEDLAEDENAHPRLREYARSYRQRPRVGLIPE